MTMQEYNFARMCAHRANITRYRKILSTELTDLERNYVQRRIDEEQQALINLEQQAAAVVEHETVFRDGQLSEAPRYAV